MTDLRRPARLGGRSHAVRALVHSVGRFSWALWLLGARQVGRACVWMDWADVPRLVGAMDGGAADGPSTGSWLDACTPRGAMRTLTGTARDAAAIGACLTREIDERLDWKELEHKLAAFYVFEHVDAVVAPLQPGPGAVSGAVERAQALEPARRVWAIEGLGHYFAEAAWAEGAPPIGFFDRAGDVGEEAGIPLHAGMGLSLAEHVLGSGHAAWDAGALRSRLALFGELCSANARDGYWGVAYETLGFVARNLYPQLVAGIDRVLAEEDDGLAAYFWHGVGRASYFAPSCFFPGPASVSRLLAAVRREAPHDLAARNMTAGLGWASTLVNLAEPRLFERLLRGAHTRDEARRLAEGARGALAAWRYAAPDDPALESFARYHTRLGPVQPRDRSVPEDLFRNGVGARGAR